MTRKFKSILLLAVILLQLTILSHFKPLSVVPNYTFVVVVAMVIIARDGESIVFAALTGLLTDMFTGAPIGLNTLLYIYICIGCAIVSEAIYNKRIKILVPICFAASFVYELLFGVLSSLLRSASFDIKAMLTVILPVAIVNSVIFIPVYIILDNVRFEKKRKGIKYEQ